MLSFKEFILEARKQDPLNILVRASRRYGEPHSERDETSRKIIQGRKIKLKNYDRKKANAMWNKLDDFDINPKTTKKTFDVKDLMPAQAHVRVDDISKLKQKIDNPEKSKINVATHKGINYIIDGHHAVMAARARGEKSVEVNHIDLDSERKK